MRRNFSSVILALVIALVMAGLNSVALLDSLEDLTLNWRFSARRAVSPKEAHPKIVLIGVDDESIEKIGGWPINRAFYGQMLERLGREKPAVAAWDIIFQERKSQDARHPLQDDELALQAGNLPYVVMAATREDEADKASLVVTGDKMLVRAGGKPEADGTETPLFEEASAICRSKPITNIKGNASKIMGSANAAVPFHKFSAPKLAALEEEFKAESGSYKNISLLANSQFGFVDCDPDSRGVRRRVPMVVNISGHLFPSLSLRAVMGYYNLTESDVEVDCGQEVRLNTKSGIIRIPIDSSGQLLINFRFDNHDFSGLSFLNFTQIAGVVDDPNSPAAEKEKLLPNLKMLKDSIVVFAATAQGIDIGATPLNPTIALVNVHMNAINNILAQDFIRQVPIPLWVGVYAVIMMLSSILLARVNLALAFFVFLLIVVVYVGTSFGLFIYSNWMLPVAFPSLGFLGLFAFVMAGRYLGERSDKIAVRKALGSYLSEKVLAEVLSHPEGVKLGGTKKEITILFSDIRGFTRYCDERDPQEVVEVLNEYLEVMSEVIIKYDGTIDKYIGDAIMAFWGAPQDQPDHAQRAVCAAVEMRYALANFKTKRVGVDRETFDCGIGVHTGDALVGNMGSTRFKNYTVIGSNVNLAARLEALTKRFTSPIIISEETRKQIKGDFTITDLGEVSVSGFAKRRRIYSVEAMQDIGSALSVASILAKQSGSTEESYGTPMFAPAPIPEDDVPVAPPRPEPDEKY
jgi:adenylate cyclase